MRWGLGERGTRAVAAAVLGPSLLLAAVPRTAARAAEEPRPTPVAVDDTFTVYGRPVEGRRSAGPGTLPPPPSYAPTPTEAGPGAPPPTAYPPPSAAERPAPAPIEAPRRRLPSWFGWLVAGIVAAVAIAASDDDD